MINHALYEGMTQDDFVDLPTPIGSIDNIQVVPANHFFELHEKLDKELGPGFSVRVGQQMEIEDYGVLGLSWKTCSWAGEIFERSERYFMLLSNTYLFKVEKDLETSRILLNREAYRRGVELSNEATLSATVVVLRTVTESDISPVEVSFKHASPEKLDDYTKAFKCPLLFNQPQNYIAYKKEDLEMRTAKADESINRFLVERVAEETKGIELSANKIVNDVENLIKDALPSGIPGVEQIGQTLGMSRRTLTRRLAENDLTFRDLIKKTQEEVSKELLKNSARSIAEIAFETGFSEQSAFSRAFKNWTNQSPIEFRKIQ
ncbi:AraC family transcriptional regulator ligand-binding domain-containing protein [Muricauda sp. 334s03]|uniref:AraC family transcriptional regulator ligand-binding domain-containing protein n=1 Tax=Flagellimonas yonaguniensis TaxID=3031325 RepID=A0ABT5Y211_9FLAO|nr:AraC family transcriptional regulator [[Muricauda] yonaguniensis]MDF0717484.1 AraC family transcriptional regulator ligand-binding domain-containing protein [[Muricauda] yonaguniensis]